MVFKTEAKLGVKRKLIWTIQFKAELKQMQCIQIGSTAKSQAIKYTLIYHVTSV